MPELSMTRTETPPRDESADERADEDEQDAPDEDVPRTKYGIVGTAHETARRAVRRASKSDADTADDDDDDEGGD